jgi:hypothetical protein
VFVRAFACEKCHALKPSPTASQKRRLSNVDIDLGLLLLKKCTGTIEKLDSVSLRGVSYQYKAKAVNYFDLQSNEWRFLNQLLKFYTTVGCFMRQRGMQPY